MVADKDEYYVGSLYGYRFLEHSAARNVYSWVPACFMVDSWTDVTAELSE